MIEPSAAPDSRNRIYTVYTISVSISTYFMKIKKTSPQKAGNIAVLFSIHSNIDSEDFTLRRAVFCCSRI
jgi:hypothetical protein